MPKLLATFFPLLDVRNETSRARAKSRGGEDILICRRPRTNERKAVAGGMSHSCVSASRTGRKAEFEGCAKAPLSLTISTSVRKRPTGCTKNRLPSCVRSSVVRTQELLPLEKYTKEDFERCSQTI